MDHYRTLQVSRDADPEVIRKAYKALCMKYHPDVTPQSERAKANRKLQRINEAYAVLGNRLSRERYDRGLPPEGRDAGWERFMEDGLLGLYLDWLHSRR